MVCKTVMKNLLRTEGLILSLPKSRHAKDRSEPNCGNYAMDPFQSCFNYPTFSMSLNTFLPARALSMVKINLGMSPRP